MTSIKLPNLEAFITRRNSLIQHIRTTSDSGVVVLNTAKEVFRSRDSDYPYRHDSDFYYMTGFCEPQSYLVLQVTPTSSTSIIFCRPKDLEREIWDGLRLGPELATQYLGVDQAFSVEELNAMMPDLLKNQTHIYSRLAISSDMDALLREWLNSLRAKARLGIKVPQHFHDIEPLIHEMRLTKDAIEISLMRKAGKIAANGHIRAMQTSRPGLREYHLEAELLYEFRRNGAQSVAYNSIVATGQNACILHYKASDAELKNGDLCLIDAGCELDSYASDITRTFPVNGKFTTPQKEVYEIVLAAQQEAIRHSILGNEFQKPHEKALEILVAGLFDLKILNQATHGTVANAIENKSYQPYYMHRTSHWLGIDVHDVGSYREPMSSDDSSRILREGMILTVEPGLYFRPSPEVPEKYWNIGIRIEDDVLVSSKGNEILSSDAPVAINDIEGLMSSSGN